MNSFSFIVKSMMCLFLFGAVYFEVVSNAPEATAMENGTVDIDLREICFDACSATKDIALALASATYQAVLDAIVAVVESLMALARAALEAVLNDPNSTQAQRDQAIEDYDDNARAIEAAATIAVQSAAALHQAAIALVFAAYEQCLTACGLVPVPDPIGIIA